MLLAQFLVELLCKHTHTHIHTHTHTHTHDHMQTKIGTHIHRHTPVRSSWEYNGNIKINLTKGRIKINKNL